MTGYRTADPAAWLDRIIRTHSTPAPPSLEAPPGRARPRCPGMGEEEWKEHLRDKYRGVARHLMYLTFCPRCGLGYALRRENILDAVECDGCNGTRFSGLVPYDVVEVGRESRRSTGVTS